MSQCRWCCIYSTTTAGVDFGASHSHAGGLAVPLAVIFERPKKKVHTHAKGSGQFFGRISMYSKVR
jgi:hypothetical protein